MGRSMPRGCAKCLSNLPHCLRQEAVFFLGSIPAICFAQQPKPLLIGRWSPFPICLVANTRPVRGGFLAALCCCQLSPDKEPLCWTLNESPPLNWRREWQEA